jgi:MFS family permease
MPEERKLVTALFAADRRDVWLITTARGLRSFAYGLLAVLLGVALSNEGLSPVAIGALITVSLAGDLVSTYVIGLFGDRWGRRRTIAGLALLMAATGAVFGLTHNYPILLVAAFFGTLGATASETAPFLPLEQAMISQASPPKGRTDAFARYNLVASLAAALGSLSAALPDLLTHLGLSLTTGIRLMFGVYAVLALVVMLLVLRLTPRVELHLAVPLKAGWRQLLPPLGASRGIILRLAGLFSLDAFAGGLVVQSLMVLFFHLRFGVPLATLGVFVFAANICSALSVLGAARLARRFGLLNTMVFTHLPSNILLALVPLMPSFPLAAVLFLVRQMLSQMDVPTRQAYTMALVNPEERTAAASVTSLARSGGAGCSPALSGLLLQGTMLTLGLPFIFAGGLKAAYDLALWAVFRRVPVEQDAVSARASP